MSDDRERYLREVEERRTGNKRPQRQGIGQWIDRSNDPRTLSRLARELGRRDREGWGEEPQERRQPRSEARQTAPEPPQREQWPEEPPMSAVEEEMIFGHTDTEAWSHGRNMDYCPPEEPGRLF